MIPAPSSEALIHDPAMDSNPAANTFILKVIAKKDSTELVVKALITRAHAPKPIQCQLKPTETTTECFLQYQTMELLKEAEGKITGEKINGAAFLIETLEVEPQDDADDEHNQGGDSELNLSSQNLTSSLSKDAIKSITDMLKQNPKRSQLKLNVSPRTKKKRHTKMKNTSKGKKKSKKSRSSSVSSEDSAGLDLDDDLLSKVSSILSKEPIAAAAKSKPTTAGSSFDPYLGIPQKPSRVLKQRTKNLIKTVHLASSSEESSKEEDKHISALLKRIIIDQKKKKKQKSKKKKRRYSSTDSSSSSDTSSSSSSTSSSSDQSPSKARRELKRLQKKGKLKSGRHRKGLAVIRNEIWPHDGINARLAGKQYPTIESLSPLAFLAGILNPILDSDEFKRLEKKKVAPKIRQKLKVINELVHGIIRSDNFYEVRDFYLSTLEEIETGQGSWKDQEYWTTQLVLFRTLLRSAPPASLRRRDQNVPNSQLQPRDCCYQFNNDGCSKPSPHPNNDPMRSPDTVHHFCKICIRKNQKKVHAAKACKEGSAPQ